MNANRTVLWMLGIVFVLAGAYLLYFEAGLSRWVSIGVLSAGFLLFIGLAVMSMASSPPDEAATVVAKDRRTVIVEQPRSQKEVEVRRAK